MKTRRSQTLDVLRLVHNERNFSFLRAIVLLIVAEKVESGGKQPGIDVQEISFQVGRSQNNLVSAMRDDGLLSGDNSKVILTDKGQAEVSRIIEGRLPGEAVKFGPQVDMQRVRAFVGHVSKGGKEERS